MQPYQRSQNIEILCPEHQERIIQVKMSAQGQNIMQCSKCLSQQSIISIDQLSYELESLALNKLNALNQVKVKSEQILSEFQKQFYRIRDEFNKRFELILRQIQQGREEILSDLNSQIQRTNLDIQQMSTFSISQLSKFIQDLKNERQDQQSQYDNTIQNIQEKAVQSYGDLLQFLGTQGPTYKKKPQSKIQIKELPTQIKEFKKYKFQFKTKQKINNCFAMDMNKNETILFIGQGYNIELWDLQNDGYLKFFQKLQGHKGNVRCLCVSKLSNWLASGSDDKTIRIWIEQKNGNWISNQTLDAHSDMVRDLVISNDENQLISCSKDNKIKIWMKRGNQVKWECRQILSQHTGDIFFLSLSPSCNQLASVGSDNLILWQLSRGEWIQKQILDNPDDDTYFRARFIDENEIISTTGNQCYLIRLIKNNQGLLEVKSDLHLTSTEDQFAFFPLEYHQQMKIAVCRQSYKEISILQRLNDGEFEQKQVINGDFSARYLTKSGEWLILAEYKNEQLLVWRGV